MAQWRLWEHGSIKYVFAKCPGCKREFRLDHDIDELGVVTPSLECPEDDCDFHDNVILVAWMEGKVEKSGADQARKCSALSE
jgi:hypothetical protein